MMSAPDQLVLDLAHPPSFLREDFVTGPANAKARAMLAELAWPKSVGVLLGQAGSGKTHLAHVFAQSLDQVIWFDGTVPHTSIGVAAFIIDGLENWLGGEEDNLFHTLETARAARLPVLVTSRQPPELLAITRPDTLSRLRSGARAQIEAPDDALFSAIAIKQFADRQLLVDPAIAAYLLQRMERSYANLSRLIALIDEHALASGRSISKLLAGQVLAAYELSQT